MLPFGGHGRASTIVISKLDANFVSRMWRRKTKTLSLPEADQ